MQTRNSITTPYTFASQEETFEGGKKAMARIWKHGKYQGRSVKNENWQPGSWWKERKQHACEGAVFGTKYPLKMGREKNLAAWKKGSRGKMSRLINVYAALSFVEDIRIPTTCCSLLLSREMIFKSAILLSKAAEPFLRPRHRYSIVLLP